MIYIICIIIMTHIIKATTGFGAKVVALPVRLDTMPDWQEYMLMRYHLRRSRELHAAQEARLRELEDACEAIGRQLEMHLLGGARG